MFFFDSILVYFHLCGFFHNKKLVKKKLQMFYDLFTKNV